MKRENFERGRIPLVSGKGMTKNLNVGTENRWFSFICAKLSTLGARTDFWVGSKSLPQVVETFGSFTRDFSAKCTYPTLMILLSLLILN